MEENHDLYCKLFVDVEVDRGALAEQIMSAVGGQVDLDTVVTPGCEIAVNRNEAFEPEQRYDPDGFLYFRYFLDVVALMGQPRDAQIELVSRLLEHFWSQGWRAVAACDFEEELPMSGGYNHPRR